jgi:hypothetical protein
MPGIDQQKSNFQPSARHETRAPNDSVYNQTKSNSLVANKLASLNSNKEKSETIQNKIVNNANDAKTQDQRRYLAEQAKVDNFQKQEKNNNTPQLLTTTISQYVAKSKEKKDRHQATQSFAQNIQDSQFGLVKAKVNNPQAKTSAEEIQTSAFVAQANVDAVDPQPTPEEKKAYETLNEIEQRGGEKGIAFVIFARREIAKGRLELIKDLIYGYQTALQSQSLTASEMVAKGQEKLTTVKHMVSASNTEELHLLNQKIIARPDSPVGFKLDHKYLRNLAVSERVAPPSFSKATQPSKVEVAIRFISTINNTALKAPWDKLA